MAECADILYCILLRMITYIYLNSLLLLLLSLPLNFALKQTRIKRYAYSTRSGILSLWRAGDSMHLFFLFVFC